MRGEVFAGKYDFMCWVISDKEEKGGNRRVLGKRKRRESGRKVKE
jgi:hypothetical protein